jgi:hypothetical protein
LKSLVVIFHKFFAIAVLTGSYVVGAIAGVEMDFNRIAIVISAQSPLVQNFVAGQTKMQFRGMAHVTFAL